MAIIGKNSHWNNMTVRAVACCLGLILGLASSVFALTPYDSFSGSVLDTTKWKELEITREIVSGQLVSKLAVKKESANNHMNMVSSLASQIYDLETDVTLDSASGEFDTSAVTNGPLKGAFPRANVWGIFYNDGSGTTQNTMGEVISEVAIGYYNGKLQAVWQVVKMLDNMSTQFSIEAIGFFDITIATGQSYKLRVQYNPTTGLTTFSVNGESHTYQPTDHYSSFYNARGLGTNVSIPLGAEYYGTVTARFDNTIGKDQSGTVVVSDDFSEANIDPAIWNGYNSAEVKREISSGQFHLRVRAPFVGSTSYNIPLRLEIANPQSMSAIQSKITVVSADSVTNASAAIGGAFFNDGSSTGSYVGDIQAVLWIGGTSTSKTANWVIARRNNTTNLDSTVTLKSGAFAKSVSVGTPYLLYVGWDGTSFTFRISDADGSNPEPVTISPGVTVAKVANYPVVSLGSRAVSTTSSAADLDALFDDVQIEYISSATITGTVKDISTGLAVSGATVSIKKNGTTAVTATTDSSGHYTAAVTTYGDFVVESSKTGYFMSSSPVPVGVYSWSTTYTANVFLMSDGPAPSMGLFDDFSASSINNSKWANYEYVREVTSAGKLRLKVRNGGGHSGLVTNNHSVIDPASVTNIQAKVTPILYQNPGAAPSAVMGLSGEFYNDPTYTAGGVAGDVMADVRIGGSGTGMAAYCTVYVLTNTDGTQSSVLWSQTFSMTPVLGQTYNMSLNWNGTTFACGIDGATLTYTPSGTKNNPNRPFVAPRVLISNGGGKDTAVEALFDDIYKNGSLYDDFSSASIDSTKWTAQEFVREITSSGKLRMKMRSIHSSSSYNETGFLYPSAINEMQAKVTPVAYTGSLDANIADARVTGRFYNDGTSGGGYMGEVDSTIGIRPSGSGLKAQWIVFKHTDPTDGYTGTTISKADFTKSLSLGTEYLLYMGWDGKKITFRVADSDGSNPEQATYTPTTEINAPTTQWKALRVRLSTYPDKDTTVEALFDEVMVGNTTPKGLTLWPGWNFVSPRLHPANGAIATVLKPVLSKILVVWGFDGATQQWLKYIPSGESNTLSSIEGGKGYWIYVTDRALIPLAGGSTPSSPIHLSAGWNLVGYPGGTCSTPAAAFSGIPSKWFAVWNWDSGTWYTKRSAGVQSPVSALSNLCEDKAYWINMKEAADWSW
jgi:hypothetical protein